MRARGNAVVFLVMDKQPERGGENRAMAILIVCNCMNLAYFFLSAAISWSNCFFHRVLNDFDLGPFPITKPVTCGSKYGNTRIAVSIKNRLSGSISGGSFPCCWYWRIPST